MKEALKTLADVAQGMSNAAASTVSAPVDLIAWLLKKGGLDVGKPTMGSDWMAERGLTRQPTNALAGYVGEGLGAAAPSVLAAKAPQVANALVRMGDNALSPRTLNPQQGAIVWHGSPHKFDRFDSSKIGTGEGAQAYGHGLYLAEDAKVAGSYQDKLSGSLPTEIAVGGRALDFRAAAAQAFGDESADALVKSGAHMKPEAWAAVADVLRSKGLRDARPMAGSLYKVDLPDNAIARMLDWDKPLSQQAEVMKTLGMSAGDPLAVVKSGNGFSVVNSRTGEAVSTGWANEAIARKFAGLGGSNADANLSGQAFYSRQASENSHRAASDYLRSKGIPGIRYLDGGSRGAGAGTSNFVVFPGEEGLLTILERNGAPIR